MKSILSGAAIAVMLSAGLAQSQVRITEWMYNGNATGSIGEFVELTNRGPAPVDFTGWSFDDDSSVPGVISLSAFGMVAPGESVVLTDNTAAAFRTAWGLSPAVKVIGGNTANLSRNDQINIFNAGNFLVDRLTYGDQNIAGTIRTNSVSGNPITLAALGANAAAQWKLSVVGDVYGSTASTPDGDIGNPGKFTLVPEPASLGMLGLVAVLAPLARRRLRRG